ncbi:DoxD-like family protein [Komagataeibacter oboediens DSM 11826]|uniref:DoxD-like family protein n=2 Tax=Komagataeibacter oboediens TaxID=65958 RepID=A0A318R1M3_9PROT|nr:DoxD-like family protein [Komagataeibacter oboediens]GBR34769.1 DoxD-like family protein [Komagataeibacter oboediens DSM 11826]
MFMKSNAVPSSYVTLRPRYIPYWPLWLGLAACVVAMVWSSFIVPVIPDFACLSTIGLDGLALAMTVMVMPRHFVIGFLASLLPFMISWRVAAIHGSVPGMATSTVAFMIYLMLYVDCMVHDRAAGWNDHLQWQTATIRIYFGFDMVGHFAEKLFAGVHSFHHMEQVFVGFGFPPDGQAVIAGGLCELSVAIGVGMGVLTRLAGIGGTLYYLIANHYGRHFGDGFTWNNAPVGGWEYPMLMIVAFASFAIAGAGKFSIDGWLIAHGWMPRFLLPLCVSDACTHIQRDARRSA